MKNLALGSLLMVLGVGVCTAGKASAFTPDQNALISLADRFGSGHPGSDPSYVLRMAICARYALVGYTDKRNSNGEFLAKYNGASWQVLTRGGGALNATEIQAYGPSSSVANFLVVNQRPLPQGAKPKPEVVYYTKTRFFGIAENVGEIYSAKPESRDRVLLDLSMAACIATARRNGGYFLLVRGASAAAFRKGQLVMLGSAPGRGYSVRPVSRDEAQRLNCRRR